MRRRPGRRDLRLPTILMGELFAGMALGLVWPQLTAAPPPIPQTAMTAVTVPARVPVVPAPPAPVAVPVVTHAPRNPFGAPDGIDTSLQQPVAPVGAAPAGTAPQQAPTDVTLPAAPGGSSGDPFAGVGIPAR